MQTTCILVVSKNETLTQVLKELLPKDRFSLLFSSLIPHAQRLLISRHIDLVIIDLPLKEESGIRFAQQVAMRPSLGLLLLMNAAFYHNYGARMEDAGIPVLSKPLSHQALYQCIHLSCTLQKRILRYEKETIDLKEKMKEIQYINQAKWLLMERKGLNEDQAHHYLLKKAMDQCCTKYEIAKQIITKFKQGGNL